MKKNIRLKIRDLVRRGGSRAGNQLKIEAPQVSATSAADKVGGNIAKQAEMDNELEEMNKKLAGGRSGCSTNESFKQEYLETVQLNNNQKY